MALSILKTGKARAVRFSMLEAICKTLHCQPGDILVFNDEDQQSCQLCNEVRFLARHFKSRTTLGSNGERVQLYACGLFIACLVGLRYPLQMLPVLLWETIWLLLDPFPQWRAGHLDESLKPAIFAVSLVVLFYLAIPWG